MWTFKFAFLNDLEGSHVLQALKLKASAWNVSSRRFSTSKEACEAAGLWLEVCLDNGQPITIAVVEAERA